MSKKLIFGLMLIFVGAFGVGNNANAGDGWSSSNCVEAKGASADAWQSINCFNADNADKIYVSQDGSWDDLNIPPNFNTCYGECKAGYKKTSKSETISSAYGNYSCDVTYDICVPITPSLTCTFKERRDAKDDNLGTPSCTEFSDAQVVDCSSYCATGTCTMWTVFGSSSTFSACSCNKCDPGSRLVKFENSTVGQCGDSLSVSLYKCEQCGIGTYSDGGTATSCTPCPENTYSDRSGSTSCKSCPAHATCSGASFTCDKDYYKNGDVCTPCPPADGVYTDKSLTTKAGYISDAGAASIYDCYLPSGTTYYDAKGTLKYNNTCYYE